MMKSRREVELKNCVNALNNMQENLIANRAFAIAERISIVDYLNTVKAEMENKLMK